MEQPQRRGRPPAAKEKDENGNEVPVATATIEEIDQMIEEFQPNEEQGRYMTLTRKAPNSHNGMKILGYIERINSIITTEEIKSRHGGGTYHIRFFSPTKRGNSLEARGSKVCASRLFDISGYPIVRGVTDQKQPSEGNNESIVKQALGTTERMVEKIEQRSEQEKATIMQLLMADKGKVNEIVPIMTKMMEMQAENSRNQLKAAELQLQLMREEALQYREEMRRKEEVAREELKALKSDMEKRNTGSTNELVNFLRETTKENTARSELTMKQLSEMTRMQMELVTQGSKTQVDILMSEMKRMGEELKEARQSSKSDLLSEMTKMSKLKELMKDMTGVTDMAEPKTDIAERVMENLPQILEAAPSIVAAIGGLFAKRQTAQVPVQQQPGRFAPRRRHGMPPPAPGMAPGPQAQPQAQQPPQAQPQAQPPQVPRPQPQPHPSQEEQMQQAEQIALIKTAAEMSIDGGTTPEAFYNEYAKQIEPEILKKIAGVPFPMVFGVLKQYLNEDSNLFSVAGRKWLTELHELIRVRNSA
jgi:hypothetical protein